MNFGIIYKAVNKINGKSYIGKTVQDLLIRKKQHEYSYDNSYFHNALKKYGVNNFNWSILCNVNSESCLNDKEKYYIKKYRTFIDFDNCNGYNMTLGGDGGGVPSKEALRRLSDALKGRPSPNKGTVFSESFKRKVSNSILSKYKNGWSPRKGRKHTIISRSKMGQIGKDHHRFGKFGKENCMSKKYIVIDPNGNEFVVHGLSEFCRKNELTVQLLNMCAAGKRIHHKGYKCKHYNENEDKGLMGV